MYDAVVVEPVPDRLLQLLDRLDDEDGTMKSRALWGERGGYEELDAGMTRDDLQRRVQLFGERAHHAGAKALSLAKFETFRKSAAFVANGDKKAVDPCRGDVDPYLARAAGLDRRALRRSTPAR